MNHWVQAVCVVAMAIAVGCADSNVNDEPMSTRADDTSTNALLSKYTSFRLTADLSHLDNDQRAVLPLLMEAADEMDAVFWRQAFGDKQQLLQSIQDADLRRFAEINYGPWDRLDGDRAFIQGVDAKPAGARFYPEDMSRSEFEAAATSDPTLRSLYTVVRRSESGTLMAIPYHEEYEAEFRRAASLMRQAARLARDTMFANYVNLRADALMSGEYRASDEAWMDMKSNDIDFVVGPIEVYEDQLFGYKAAAEAYLLIKDREWSERLTRYADLLPRLQQGLPVDSAYKAEQPGTNSDLNAYDAIYYAGHANAGSKTIAINLPNDEVVQATKGSRRLQLKNTMRAKFDEILEPIAGQLIAAEMRRLVTFDAFFANTMLHEVAHGLGIKQTIDGAATVREALREHYSAIEEGKADILGLYMATSLIEQEEMEGDVRENYVTFLAGIFRSIRFGASSAHGKANMIRFNFFKEMGAFTRSDDGLYAVDFDRIAVATDSLSERILQLQGDGDFDAAADFVETYAVVGDELRSDLDRLAEAGIPVDVTFVQGMTVLP